MSCVADLFPAYVASQETRIFPNVEELHPAEAAQITGAVESRQREFTAGRACAHEALSHLGSEFTPLLIGPDRAPLWPRGFVGSISHTSSYCAAVAAPTAQVRSLGLDVEDAEGLEPDLMDLVLRPDEKPYLEQPSIDSGHVAKLFFSAKEAVFKCRSPLTQHFLGFHEVSVRFDFRRGTFEAAIDGVAERLSGRFKVAGGLILTGTILRA